MFYYNFNISDYRNDTSHLSFVEHGIYRMLIDWQVYEEKPIPLETQVVLRRLRLGSDSDMVALRNVLDEFFIKREDGYSNPRVEQMIRDYHVHAQKNRENGKKGGRPKSSQSSEKTHSVTSRLPLETESNPTVTLTNKQRNKETKNTTTPHGFDLFWSAYPKKKAKGRAEKAWLKINPDDDLLSKIIDGVEKSKSTDQWKKDRGQWIPHPATWLNDQCWLDSSAEIVIDSDEVAESLWNKT